MIRSILSFCLAFFKSRTQLQLEIVYLRKQLDILARTSPKPRLKNYDRLFFTLMKDIFGAWKNALLIVKPEAVIKWHWQGFKLYWRWKSRPKGGRTKTPQEQIDLLKQMVGENPDWGLHEFTVSCWNSGLIFQNLPYYDACPRNPEELPDNVGRHFSRIIPWKSLLWISLLYRPLHSSYFMYWSFFHMTEERSFISTWLKIPPLNGVFNNWGMLSMTKKHPDSWFGIGIRNSATLSLIAFLVLVFDRS